MRFKNIKPFSPIQSGFLKGSIHSTALLDLQQLRMLPCHPSFVQKKFPPGRFPSVFSGQSSSSSRLSIPFSQRPCPSVAASSRRHCFA
jgi:hypothetical protein